MTFWKTYWNVFRDDAVAGSSVNSYTASSLGQRVVVDSCRSSPAPWWRCFGALSRRAHSSDSSSSSLTAAQVHWQPRWRVSRANSPVPSAWRSTINPSASPAVLTRKVALLLVWCVLLSVRIQWRNHVAFKMHSCFVLWKQTDVSELSIVSVNC